MSEEKFHSLLELNQMVRETIECEMPDEYWVEAELSECRELRGHCYMELIQKDERTATPVAKSPAKCWANKWAVIRPYFERTTGQQLHAGMKVLLKVYAQFHEAYGFSWIVTDINPEYTLGDMARKRQEIIRQLKAEGVFDLQKELTLPPFCQHIAVISSQTAAGYGDFCNQLSDNPYGFQFQTQLFPAIMQGEGVEQSIIDALEKIYSLTSSFSPLTPKLGLFATTVDMGLETDFDADPYQKMMVQLLADRLAEAAAERMHEQIRKEYWGYAKDENLSIPDMLVEKFQGIRPAVGYPSLPDTSLNFVLDDILDMKQIGIRLTESGAMKPHASVSGMMFSHPQARYFNLGKIGEDQLQDYARRRGLPVEVMRKFLASNL